MEDEIKFKCELCGKQFDPVPDAMLECNANFKAIDPETGEEIQLDEETRAEILADAATDPEIGPFLKGVICVCLECQQKFADDADEITPAEE